MMEKQEITKKVCDLYRKYGIKSITMDDAARHLGISKKTLYQHFSDKTDLVREAVVKEISQRQNNLMVLNRENSNAIEDLLDYYKIQVNLILDYKPNFVYDLKKYYPDIYDNYVRIKRERIIESTRKNLEKGKQEGFYREDLNVDIISRLLLMRIEGMIHSGIFTTEELLSPTVFTELFKYHLYGIVSNKGREYFEKHKDKLTIR
jgi:AcrR family transcriptional regulator